MLGPLVPLIAAVGLIGLIALSFAFLPIEVAWLICAALLAAIIYVIRTAAARPFHLRAWITTSRRMDAPAVIARDGVSSSVAIRRGRTAASRMIEPTGKAVRAISD
jgi:hypothetical protein